jgi:glutathione S-transferase
MELYHNDMSVCAQKVRLVLAEKALAPHLHHLNLRTGETHTAAYLALNPNGVVPTLVDHGRPIIESTVICEYLEDAYPHPQLAPPDPYARAQMRLWTLRPDAGLHKACGMTSFALAFRYQSPERQIAGIKDPERRASLEALVRLGLDMPGIDTFVRQFVSMLDAMAAVLKHSPWLAGNAYSLADAAMLPYVVRLDHLQLAWLWRSPSRAAVADWYERATTRPNYSGIANYLDATYLAQMREHGGAAQDRVKALLAA